MFEFLFDLTLHSNQLETFVLICFIYFNTWYQFKYKIDFCSLILIAFLFKKTHLFYIDIVLTIISIIVIKIFRQINKIDSDWWEREEKRIKILKIMSWIKKRVKMIRNKSREIIKSSVHLQDNLWNQFQPFFCCLLFHQSTIFEIGK